MSGLRSQGRRLLGQVFVAGQRVGLDVLPRHFYSSIPDVAALRRATEWRQPHSMIQVAGADLDDQRRFLDDCFRDPVKARLAARSVYDEATAENGTLGYGPMEAEILYAFAASHRPAKVVQVGAGVSTAVLMAASVDFELEMDIVCVDPHPTPFLVAAAERCEIRLLAEPAQDVDLAVLTDVGPGGLLFVDSTHTVKPGSEVNRLILEVLPRLPAGSFAHFHDITFPFDYPHDVLAGRMFFWQESTLLLAFLTNNPAARIALSTSMLHHLMPDALARHLARYHPMAMDRGIMKSEGHIPSSTYLQFA